MRTRSSDADQIDARSAPVMLVFGFLGFWGVGERSDVRGALETRGGGTARLRRSGGRRGAPQAKAYGAR